MIRVVHPGSRIRILTYYPSRIPDPGVKKAPLSSRRAMDAYNQGVRLKMEAQRLKIGPQRLKIEPQRLKMEPWGGPKTSGHRLDSHHLVDEQDPIRIRINGKSPFRIRFNVKRCIRIRIRIKVMRIRNPGLWNNVP
jgi:hypothetical protein